MKKLFVISDNHWNHFNIIKYCNRPFSSVEEMNEVMINNWNKAISKDDVVFHLGDFAFGRKRDNIQEIFNKLNGYKVLVMGNHDRRKPVSFWYDIGFKKVHKKPFLIILNGTYTIFSHRPVNNLPEDFLNYHGHIHEKKLNKAGYINVSVEQIDYKPLLIGVW